MSSNHVHIFDNGNIFRVDSSHDEIDRALTFYRKERERHRLKSIRAYERKKALRRRTLIERIYTRFFPA